MHHQAQVRRSVRQAPSVRKCEAGVITPVGFRVGTDLWTRQTKSVGLTVGRIAPRTTMLSSANYNRANCNASQNSFSSRAPGTSCGPSRGRVRSLKHIVRPWRTRRRVRNQELGRSGVRTVIARAVVNSGRMRGENWQQPTNWETGRLDLFWRRRRDDGCDDTLPIFLREHDVIVLVERHRCRLAGKGGPPAVEFQYRVLCCWDRPYKW